MSEPSTYDEKRMSLTPCPCGRWVSNPPACQAAGCCLVDRREQQIAARVARQ